MNEAGRGGLMVREKGKESEAARRELKGLQVARS